MHVVEDDNERADPGVPLEQLANGPEGFLRASDAVGQPDRVRDSLRNQLCVRIVFDNPLDVPSGLHVHQLSQNLRDRPEGDSLAI